jgi:amino acid adenylation domain-containing protein
MEDAMTEEVLTGELTSEDSLDDDAYVFPTSFAQQRLWFLDQLEPGSPFYNVPAAVRLKGSLSDDALERSLYEIIRRHETLRTSFAEIDGQPMQIIAPEINWRLERRDLREMSEGSREAEAQRLATEEARRPFDLTRAPLLRAALLRLDEDEHMLLLTMHHIISDGWSLGVFIHELGALYVAFAEGRPSPLPELSIQYADFSHWEREWLRGEHIEEHLAYWRRKLAGKLPVLELPTTHSRPRVQTYRGGRHYFEIPIDLAGSLRELARSHETTLFMVLLAAFKTLLHRYTAQEDIIVGAPSANRNHGETENLIGFFVNTLVLRTDLSDDPAFTELLGRVRETVLEAHTHQEVPFEKLVEELQPERSLGHTPLFQVMFAFQNTVLPSLALPGLELSLLKLDTGTAKFDLMLMMAEAEEGLSGSMEYNADLFDEEAIRRLSTHLLNLLRSVATDATLRLSRLSLLSESERRMLTSGFGRSLITEHEAVSGMSDEVSGVSNESRDEVSDEVSGVRDEVSDEVRAPTLLHDLFERRAHSSPTLVAVESDTTTLSYRELNSMAAAMARALQTVGARPDTRIGVLMQRTPRLVAALLGVLKSGAAYVPLDPDYPSERVRFMLEDSGARVVVSERALLAEWSERLGESVEVIVSEDVWGEGDGALESVARDDADVSETRLLAPLPENLAYVIYTSGSTGRPKGVMITHRSASLLLDWALSSFTSEELSGVLASTSICFDLSIFELFAPLSAGGRVLLADNALEWPTSATPHVRLINTVPSVMAELLRSREGRLPEGVRVVNLAGEALSRALVEAVYESGEVERVWNLYGPSEDTTYSTGCIVEREQRRGERREQGREQGAGSVPRIGRPLAGARAYVLDRHLEPVAEGVAGELCLGGEGLARGYLARPELTAERFVPDPFTERAGGRMYRTGDVARWDERGELEYLGRMDEQVKIRGFRIEPGEVEAVVREREGVEEVAVVARGDGRGGLRLVCYYVGAERGGVGLREWARERLPEHLVPAAVVRLERLPLTPSGKLDRRALPEPEVMAAESGAEKTKAEREAEEPRGEVERVVCGVWAEVLGLGRVGVGENFFELGGHSLLATQVTSRLRDATEVEVNLRTFFANPTVAQLAAYIESQLKNGAGKTKTVSLARISRELYRVKRSEKGTLAVPEVVKKRL